MVVVVGGGIRKRSGECGKHERLGGSIWWESAAIWENQGCTSPGEVNGAGFFLMARLEPKQIVVFVGFVARQGTWVRALKLPRQAAEERKL